MTEHVQTVIVGAGQAGLALSRCLTDAGVEHVLLERGRVAERWRSERWESFRLLSPNWQTRLPGWAYDGPDPDGFMGRDEVVDFFDRYADSFAAPVRAGVAVHRVRRWGRGWELRTGQGRMTADDVVVATGHLDRPSVPAVADRLPPTLHRLHTSAYRSPTALPDGGVLVVGAGPSGQQIALELAEAGRAVTLAVGRHRPLPRRYRGRDAYWWMDRMGLLDRTVDTLPSVADAERAPAAVLAGGADDLNLDRLQRAGVRPVGRLLGVEGSVARLSDDLDSRVRDADANDRQFREAVDAFVARHGVAADEGPSRRPATPVPDAPTQLDLAREGIGTVVWATGFGRDWSWLPPDVVDPTGRARHRRGVTPAPGLYFLGLRWQYRRRSSFIDGVGEDAAYLAERIRSRHLDATPSRGRGPTQPGHAAA